MVEEQGRSVERKFEQVPDTASFYSDFGQVLRAGDMICLQLYESIPNPPEPSGPGGAPMIRSVTTRLRVTVMLDMALAQAFGYEFTPHTSVAAASPQAPFRVRIVEEPEGRSPAHHSARLQVLPDVGPMITTDYWVVVVEGWDWATAPAVVVGTPARQRVDDDPYGLNEMAWFDSRLDELRRQHPEKYVAIKDRSRGYEIVAAADTVEALLAELDRAGIDDATITQITDQPWPEATVYGY